MWGKVSHNFRIVGGVVWIGADAALSISDPLDMDHIKAMQRNPWKPPDESTISFLDLKGMVTGFQPLLE